MLLLLFKINCKKTKYANMGRRTLNGVTCTRRRSINKKDEGGMMRYKKERRKRGRKMEMRKEKRRKRSMKRNEKIGPKGKGKKRKNKKKKKRERGG